MEKSIKEKNTEKTIPEVERILTKVQKECTHSFYSIDRILKRKNLFSRTEVLCNTVFCKNCGIISGTTRFEA